MPQYDAKHYSLGRQISKMERCPQNAVPWCETEAVKKNLLNLTQRVNIKTFSSNCSVERSFRSCTLVWTHNDSAALPARSVSYTGAIDTSRVAISTVLFSSSWTHDRKFADLPILSTVSPRIIFFVTIVLWTVKLEHKCWVRIIPVANLAHLLKWLNTVFLLLLEYWNGKGKKIH